MARVLHSMPLSTLPDAGNLELDDQMVAYKKATGEAYRSTVGGLAEVSAHDIGDAFSENETYHAGDYVIYNDTLYRFTADKKPGVWDGSVVEATTVSDEMTGLTDAVSELSEAIDNMPQVEAGGVRVYCSANTISSQSVTFPTAFKSTPSIIVTPVSTVPGTRVQEVAVASRSATGFTIYAYRTNTETMDVSWIAMDRT